MHSECEPFALSTATGPMRIKRAAAHAPTHDGVLALRLRCGPDVWASPVLAPRLLSEARHSRTIKDAYLPAVTKPCLYLTQPCLIGKRHPYLPTNQFNPHFFHPRYPDLSFEENITDHNLQSL